MSSVDPMDDQLPTLKTEDSLDSKPTHFKIVKEQQGIAQLSIPSPLSQSKLKSEKMPPLTSKSSGFSKKQGFNSISMVNLGNAYKTSTSNFRSPSSKTGRDLGFVNDKQSVPGPGFYQTESTFKKEGKAYDFSKAPDRIPVNAYVSSEVLKVPAPGQYNIFNLKEKNSPAYTMSQKTKDTSFIGIQPIGSEDPGPGYYENPEILSGEGKYVLSTHKNTKGALISTPQTPKYVEFKNTNPGPNVYNTDNLKQKNNLSFTISSKFKDPQGVGMDSLVKNQDLPGPGQYENSEVFSQDGHYVLSTHQNVKAALISPRETPKYVEFKNKNPGPGEYIKQTDIMAQSQSKLQTFDSSRKGLKVTQEADLSVPGPGSYKVPSDFDNKYDAVAKKLKLQKKGW